MNDRDDPETDGLSRYSAPALEKGLDILEHLSKMRRPQTLGEVADALGRTRGEIFRMVAVLQARGYIEREDNERFVIADKLFRLGLNRPVYRSLVEAALPVMRAFAESTGYSCHLAVPSETQMVVVARVESVSHIGFSVRIGYRQPLALTGSGHCLLAFMNARRRSRTLVAIAAEEPLRDIEALVVDLDRFRQAGRVVRASSIAAGVTDISVPIFEIVENGAVAALTCPHIHILVAPVEPDALAERVEAAARQIGETIASR